MHGSTGQPQTHKQLHRHMKKHTCLDAIDYVIQELFQFVVVLIPELTSKRYPLWGTARPGSQLFRVPNAFSARRDPLLSLQTLTRT